MSYQRMQRVCRGHGPARAVAVSEHSSLWRAGKTLVPAFWVTAVSQMSYEASYTEQDGRKQRDLMSSAVLIRMR